MRRTDFVETMSRMRHLFNAGQRGDVGYGMLTRSALVVMVGFGLALSSASCGATRAGLTAPHAPSGPGAARKPNIVLIYADDVGWGDVSAYGATKVQTPHIDAVARAGLRFTDGHAAAATCTPSRYALLTGEYAFRKEGTNILPGDAALIVTPGRTTLPSMLQTAGYDTAVVGKWHLGLGRGREPLDWNGELAPGPLDVGFDHAFILPATGDRVPTVYVEDRRVVGLEARDPLRVDYEQRIGDEPTGKLNPELLHIKPSHGHADTIVNGISRIGFMAGGRAARWVDEDMADTLTRRAVRFIEASRGGPFFLYFAPHDIHVPRVPHGRFRHQSGCGVRCDALVELDWSVGEITKTLARLGLTNDTIVIVSSDNGPVVDDGYADGAVADLAGHTPSGPWRGGKYSPFEGGTRVPFIVSWPGTIAPGVSDALVSQVDLLASFAAMLGVELPAGAGPDSVDVHAALLGKSPRGRAHHVAQARTLSLRAGSWKLVEPKQLYDLASDPAEATDVAAANPRKLAEMVSLLERLRSTTEVGARR